MALEYIIDMECIPREELPAEAFMERIKRRNSALPILKALKARGMTDKEARDTELGMDTVTPDGTKTSNKHYKVSDMLADAESLNKAKGHCKKCPASRGMEFGCYYQVKYPISAKAEEWLVEVAKNALDLGPDLVLAKGMILDFILTEGVTGAYFGSQRAAPDGGVILELRKPLEVEFSKGHLGFLGRKVINTNQLLDVLFAMKRMHPPHMYGLLSLFWMDEFIFGANKEAVIADQQKKPKKFLQTGQWRGGDGTTVYAHFALEDRDTNDYSIRQLKEFFRHVFTAYCLGKDIAIST